MTITPPPPTDLPGLIEAYAATTGAVLELASAVTGEAAERETDCPGWTVLDQVRHVLSVEGLLLGESIPQVDVSRYAHVRSEFGGLIEMLVEGRRALGVDEVVAQLRSVVERRLAVLRDPALTVSTPSFGPLGPAPLGEVLTLRVFDIWCHEQDVREALGVPGGFAGASAASPSAAASVGASAAVASVTAPAAASVAIGRALSGVPRALARGAGLAAGDVVRLVVSGPVAVDYAVTMVAGPDGRLRGMPLGSGGEGSADEGVGGSVAVPGASEGPEPTVTIGLTTREFTRRVAGRWPVSRLAPTVVGDAAVAARVLEALVVTP